ncbi:MAG: response regulator [Ignavibacteria bacterium]|nr:response regulator [Ignavibacteria bacterium]MBT8391263.1 response regulator [Ignavibacteria bacterium]NNL21684.1 response regulator [Ignavibacteriaceae bacterium]
MKINILLVDDEEDFVDSLAERLRLRDFVVETAFNGVDAIKSIKQMEFDIIFLDVKMPGMDGIEVLKQIKKLKPLPQVIMLTGNATVESAIEGMKVGAYDYIMKPVVTEDLIELINKAYKIVEEQKEKIRKAEVDNILKKRGW